MLDARTFPDANVVKHSAQFVPVKIDTDKNRDLAKKFQIRALPLIAFVDAEGNIRESALGFRDAGKFVALLDGVASKQLANAKEIAGQRPDDGKAQALLGMVLAAQGQAKPAEEALKRARDARFIGPTIGRAFNSLAETLVSEKKPESAIDSFMNADRYGKDPVVRAYAKHRLMEIHQERGEKNKARDVAQSLTELDGAPAEYVKAAKKYLNG